MKQTVVWRWIIPIALLRFVISFWLVNPVYELQRDEYLYFQQGQHPAWGYLENPPLLSWLGSISGWFGNAEFSIRFWPALIGVATILLVAKIAAKLGGGAKAQCLAAIAMLCAVFMRIFVLFQPNAVDIFSWTLIVYVLTAFLQTGSRKYLYALGPAVALGVYSKYSVAFILIALLAGILLTRTRTILLKKECWISAGIGAMLIAPNMIWQMNHNWPVIHHMKELQETQLQFVSPLDFIKEQFLMTLPLFFLWVAGLVWAFRNRKFRFLGIAYVLVLVLLLLGRGKPYYAVGIYPPLIAAGAVVLERMSRKQRWIPWVAYGFMLSINLLILPILLPVWKPEKMAAYYERIKMKHRWEDLQEHPLPQDFADMLGWKQLAEKTEEQWQRLPADIRDSTIVLASGYGQAGSILFYAGDTSLTTHVYSTNGSFLLWMPDSLSIRHVLVVEENPVPPDHFFYSHFKDRQLLDSTTADYSRTIGSQIWLMQDPEPGLQARANEMLHSMKAQFSKN